MITLIVPTRNRSRILRITASSYFQQELVDEILIIDDAGNEDTEAVVAEIAARYPHVVARVLRNHARLGASQSRNVGVAAAKNEFVLFCDDDERLEPHYARTCLAKLEAHDAAAVSGRRVYMLPGETPEAAVARFGEGLRRTKPFRPLICEYVNGAAFPGDLELPITNAVILTRRSLLLAHPFDPFYARGNGYREETDFQMNLYTRGYRIIVTNDCHSIHLPLAEVTGGGQRTGRIKRIAWSIYYTDYFFRKYYQKYAARQGLRAPRSVALAAFSAFAVYRTLLRPLIYPLAIALLARRPAARLEVAR